MLLVLPWLLGNPLVLMVGLAAIPAVQKAIVPVVDQVWRAFFRCSGIFCTTKVQTETSIK
jgi:hypothetical protein